MRTIGIVALLALGLAGSARAGCSIGVMEMPVKMVGTRPIATVSINGTPVTLLVDSGAFFSMLMRSTATDLNLPLKRLPFPIYGVNGRIPDAKMTTVEHLKLLSGDLPGIDFMVAGNEIGDTAMGVIGRNILGALDTEYDLAHGVVRLVRPGAGCDDANMAYWAGETPVSELELLAENTLGNPAIRAKIQVNGQDATALFDTGASTAVSLATARRVGIQDADMKPGDVAYGAGRGKSKSWTADFTSVSLGGETVRHNRLIVAEFGTLTDDMLVGVDFFLSHRVYVSKKQHKMFFTYNGGAVFAQNHGAPAAPADAASAADTLSADEHARRGAASLSRKEFDAALADLDRACALEPANASFLATRAAIHAGMKQPALAIADLDASLRLAPGNVQARISRAALHVQGHAPALAIIDLDAIDKLLSPQSNDRAPLADLYAKAGQPERSISQWTLWIAAHPHDIHLEQAYNGRCWSRMLLGRDPNLAMQDCEEALNADSKNWRNLDSRGWLWLRLGQPDKARADFDKAIALDKSDKADTSLYGRGILRQRQGDAAGAQADFAAARAIEHDIDAQMKDIGLPLAPDAAQASAAAAAAFAASAASR